MMTLNAAIRNGCRLRKSWNAYIHQDGSCCVIGAAYVGGVDETYSFGGGTDSADVYKALYKLFPETHQPSLVGCDGQSNDRHVCGMSQKLASCTSNFGRANPRQLTVLGMADHLHCIHNWSREAIAEWLDPTPENHVPMPVEKVALPMEEVHHG